MPAQLYTVLFLSTENAARSILAEALLNHWGQGRFRAYSAASRPAAAVHPLALEVLERARLPTAGLRPKGWTELAHHPMDFVFILSNPMAGEAMPSWPGAPITAHWPFVSPATFRGLPAQQVQLFQRVYNEIRNRVQVFADLRIEALDRLALQHRVEEIGVMPVGELQPKV